MGPRKHLLEKGKKFFLSFYVFKRKKKKILKEKTIKANHLCEKEQFKQI